MCSWYRACQKRRGITATIRAKGIILKTIWGIHFIAVGILSASALTVSAEKKADIQLRSTFTGDKTEPSISHFVQWKPTQSNDYLRWDLKPKASDDILKVADRDIVRRRMDIYSDLQLEKRR